MSVSTQREQWGAVKQNVRNESDYECVWYR